MGQFKVDLTTDPITITLPATVRYIFPHFVGSADAITYTPTVTKDVYTKLVPSMTAKEADGITFAADSLTIVTPGDYRFDISVRFSGANQNDIWQIKIYKNTAAMDLSAGRFITRTTAASLSDAKTYFWYLLDLVAGDDISFRMTNLTATRNPTIQDFKILCEMRPE